MPLLPQVFTVKICPLVSKDHEPNDKLYGKESLPRIHDDDGCGVLKQIACQWDKMVCIQGIWLLACEAAFNHL